MKKRNRGLSCIYHQIIPKQKPKSRIWKYYGCPADESGNLVSEKICICKMCLKCVSSKATSNLWAHLKVHHAVKYFELNQILTSNPCVQDQVKIEVDESPVESPNPDSTSQSHDVSPSCSTQAYGIQKSLLDCAPLDDRGTEKCTLLITKFLAFGMQPYNLVEDESFKQLIKGLNPRYTMPDRKYFSDSAIPKLYLEGVEKLKKILLKSNKNISITCDCSNSLAGQPYIAITVHLIDLNWNLISACLNCCYFDENYSPENIKDMIQCKIEEWGLVSQDIVSCTTDNDANIVNAIEKLKVPHISCLAHSINIGVNRCIVVQQVKNAISRVKLLQNFIAHSRKMKRDLKEAQQLLKCEIKNLPSACSTRWWSTLKLSQRFLDNYLPLSKMLQNFPSKKNLLLEGNDHTSLETFVKVVKSLQEITENLTGEHFVTSSAVLPLVRKIKKNVKPNTDDSNLEKLLKEKISSALEKYEEEPMQGLLEKCTFLDPRFKLNFFDSDVKYKVKKVIIDEVNKLRREEDATRHQRKLSTKKKTGGLAACLEDEEDSYSCEDEGFNEVQKYLYMPKIGLNDNPLIWWNNHSLSFPSLSFLAKKYLCAQGSSVSSERVFSTGGSVINKKMCALSPKNAEMQIFLATNKKILGI